MKRDIGLLASREWDLLVVGGGIHGAFIAREAALRGLEVALVEKGDFVSATSSQSQKIVHSGLRYLQHGDLPRLRQSVRERTALLKMAPHLVRLLPVLVPAYGHGRRGREILSLATVIHDLFGFDRNRGLGGDRSIPRGRSVGPAECRRLFPEVDVRGLTGGALWYDAQIVNTERFVLSLLHDAASRGAALANYLEVTGFRREGSRITGAVAREVTGGRTVDVRSRVVVNATGPWLGEVCSRAGLAAPEPRALSRAMVLVVSRPLVREVALGLPGRAFFRDPDVLIPRGERLFFITPWRGFSLVGSAHLPFSGRADDCEVTEEEVGQFLADVNEACPSWAVRREEVTSVYRGLLPSSGTDDASGSIQVEKRQRIRDHGPSDGVEGMISILGVKYTTAREAAVRIVALAGRKLGRRLAPSPGDNIPVEGGRGGTAEDLLREALEGKSFGLDRDVLLHLTGTYGSSWGKVIRLLEEDRSLADRIDPSLPVIAAEIVYGIREEMALRLDDLLLRRTDVGSAGHPGRRILECSAEVAGRELGWDGETRDREVERTEGAWTL
jgi:glycerol-3-phosphate dehydrogenase